MDLRTRRLHTKGLNARLRRAWRGRVFVGGTRGSRVVSGIYALSQRPSGTQPRFGITVAGVNTPASVTVAGSDVTFVSATNASSQATSTARAAVAALRASAAASALIYFAEDPKSPGNPVVSASALTTLAA